MITVAVVAILAAVALPSYRDYILRGHLVTMTNDLVAARANMEQYYQDNRSYLTTTAASAPSPCTNATATASATVTVSKPTPYSMTCSHPTSSTASSTADKTYTLTATGTSGTVVDGFSYTITQTGVQGSTMSTAWGGATYACWIMRKGDSC